MISRLRLPLFMAVILVMVVVFTTVGMPYSRFGALNKAWAGDYTVGEDGGDSQFEDFALCAVLSPSGGSLLAGAKLFNYGTYAFDSVESFNVPADSVAAYRQTEFGDLIKHPTYYSGNVVAITAVGTGTYCFYSAANPAALQIDVIFNEVV